jgi:hypothetical protein
MPVAYLTGGYVTAYRGLSELNLARGRERYLQSELSHRDVTAIGDKAQYLANHQRLAAWKAAHTE